MRIGVYFRESAEEGGGGFTFEDTLLEALLSRAAGSSHSFVFLGPQGIRLDRLSQAGFEVVAVPISGAQRAFMKVPRIGKVATESLRERAPRGRAETGLDRLVEGANIDVLWCLGPDVVSTEVPFLVTVWDLQHRLQPFFPEVSKNGVWVRRERYFSRTLRRAAFIITGTQRGREEIERFYGIMPERILVAPHPTPGFPTATTSDEEVLERLGLEPGYLLYPAQFWPHKDHVTLLRAVRSLIDQQRATRLVLVGSDWGKNRGFVENEIARLGLDGDVRILGFVDRSDLAALYRGALALTYPSLFGPENLPPLEAFSLGCPVIAADVPGAREQLGGCAVLFEPTDDVALAEAVARIQHDGPDTRLIEEAKALADQRTPLAFVESVFNALEGFASVRRTWPSGP